MRSEQFKKIGFFLAVLIWSLNDYLFIPLIAYFAITAVRKEKKLLTFEHYAVILFSIICLLIIFNDGAIKTRNLSEISCGLLILGIAIKEKFLTFVVFAFYVLIAHFFISHSLLLFSIYELGSFDLVKDQSRWTDFFISSGGLNGLFYSLAIVGPFYINQLKNNREKLFSIFFGITVILGSLSGMHQKACLVAYAISFFILTSVYLQRVYLYISSFSLVAFTFFFLNSNIKDLVINFGGVRLQEYFNLFNAYFSSISVESTFVRVFQIYGIYGGLSFILLYIFLFTRIIFSMELTYMQNKNIFSRNKFCFVAAINFIVLAFFSSNFFIISGLSAFVGWIAIFSVFGLQDHLRITNNGTEKCVE